MGRRRQNSSLMMAGAQLFGLLFIATIFIPQAREIVIGFCSLALGLVVILAAIALVVLICVWWFRAGKKRDKQIESYLFVNAPSTAEKHNSIPVDLQPGVHENNKAVPWISSCIPAPAPEPPSTEQFLEKIRTIDWFQFEKLVAAMYRKLGYEVTSRGGANPDGGIDLIIEQNGQKTAVQCKQWKTWNVGVKAIREFLGALTDSGITKGCFVTLYGYTGEAKVLADKHGIAILNETNLIELLKTVDAQFDPEMIALLDDTHKICPKCERDLVLREAKKGRGLGGKFWGCSTYPRCRFTMPV